jgi:hypothetical protein
VELEKLKRTPHKPEVIPVPNLSLFLIHARFTQARHD